MPFKPLTKTALAKKPDSDPAELSKPESSAEIIAATTERIRIIFDDSGSMHSPVIDNKGNLKVAYELATDATIDYMKSCTPKTTAVNIDFLNEPEIPMTRNLPKIAPEVKAKASSGGGTPMWEHLRLLISKHQVSKFTRALIFTDGQFGMSYDSQKIMDNLLELGIPIDFILIGDMTVANLFPEHKMMKDLAEKSKGQFLICKDGAAFKAKLKYFAPPLRHMLAAVASRES